MLGMRRRKEEAGQEEEAEEEAGQEEETEEEAG